METLSLDYSQNNSQDNITAERVFSGSLDIAISKKSRAIADEISSAFFISPHREIKKVGDGNVMYKIRCTRCEETFFTKGRICAGEDCRFGEGIHRHLICPTCGLIWRNDSQQPYNPETDDDEGDTISEKQAIAALCRISIFTGND